MHTSQWTEKNYDELRKLLHRADEVAEMSKRVSAWADEAANVSRAARLQHASVPYPTLGPDTEEPPNPSNYWNHFRR